MSFLDISHFRYFTPSQGSFIATSNLLEYLYSIIVPCYNVSVFSTLYLNNIFILECSCDLNLICLSTGFTNLLTIHVLFILYRRRDCYRTLNVFNLSYCVLSS